ncbi:MAG: DNA gyrase/topoisomerase IV subunit A [Opitutaceae bacterium]|nr:DNA gyrase/topoisomerase IV subunit A [Cytophagales bacterium]
MSKDKLPPLNNDKNSNNGEDHIHDVVPVSGMFENYFLDYASYVILERAVPAIEDGLKPVQRRILHSMEEMDDGRYNKVANIIGHTMQFHPHGDASIGDAIVNIGQKDLLIDTQGNWGDIRTGDSAAAPRYIEARLSKFALDIAFNSDTTVWQLSYDGRNKEPVTLPMKFPLLLAQGVEGIAVGLSTKVLPHNFCELILATIDILKGNDVIIYPDFPTGGMVDITNYNGGARGGKVRVRARIVEIDKKTLHIKEIPFGTTTGSLIESIIKANDSGKIKIKKVIDNTAKDVEVEIQLQPGVDPDVTIDALYAFSDCEISISPNACIIVANKPRFMNVNDILKICTENAKELLRQELLIKKADLLEKIFFSSLLKIFIQEGMYKNPKYENAEDDQVSFDVLNVLFGPHFPIFYRKIENEDYLKLMARPLSSIRKYDVGEADLKMKDLEDQIKEVDKHLKHLTDFTIAYFQRLLDKYGKGRERKTELRTFDMIVAHSVAAANEKLYVNRKDGFIGFGLKKDEYICDCSDIDDVAAFLSDGKFKVVKISEKVFVGKDILHAGVFRKNDERMVFNMVYLDGKSGNTMIKRFQIGGITRDKEYDLTMGNKMSKVLYFSANPNGEAEIINIQLSQSSTARLKIFDFDFSTVSIKGRSSQGNILTKYPVRKIAFKQAGKSTLSGIKIWYSDAIGRLNTDEKGKLLGNFEGSDKIIVFYKDGSYEITGFELTNRYEPDQLLLIEKYDAEKIISAVHFDAAQKNYYVKRFKIEVPGLGKKHHFISDANGSKLVVVSTRQQPQVEVEFINSKGVKETTISDLDMLIDVKGWKALGNKLSGNKIEKVVLLGKEEIIEEPAISEDSEPTIDPEKFDVGTSINLDVKKKDDGQMGLF